MIISVIIGVSLLLTALLGWVYGAAVHSGDYTKVGIIRLHILAHSDSDADQLLKRRVRDAVIEYMKPYMEISTSKGAAEQIISEHMPEIQNIAQQIIRENGYDYPVAIELGNHPFPTKSYGTLALPAGNYQALRILIGDAQGQNWWCVLFPPLCFVDVTNATAVSTQTNQITEEINNQQTPEFRFKIIELFFS
jgi:stage II sporulation protein R